MCGTSIPPLLCEHISQDISCYENLDSTCCWVKMLFFFLFVSCWSGLPIKYIYILWGWIWLLAFKEGIVCYSQLVKDNHSNKKSVLHTDPAVIHRFVLLGGTVVMPVIGGFYPSSRVCWHLVGSRLSKEEMRVKFKFDQDQAEMKQV